MATEFDDDDDAEFGGFEVLIYLLTYLVVLVDSRNSYNGMHADVYFTVCCLWWKVCASVEKYLPHYFRLCVHDFLDCADGRCTHCCRGTATTSSTSDWAKFVSQQYCINLHFPVKHVPL